MWSLRRISTNSLKSSGLNLATFRACAGLGGVSSHKEDKLHASVPHLLTADRWMTSTTCKRVVPIPKQCSAGCRCHSSKAGINSGEEDDELEDGFSELETPEATETVKDLLDGDSSSDSTSDSESEAEAEAEADLSIDTAVEDTLQSELVGGIEEEVVTTAAKKKHAGAALFKAIYEERGPSVSGVLNKYFEGKEVTQVEVYTLLLGLRRRKLFMKALQVSEWLEAREDFEFSERDYASRVDLISKVRGLEKADKYIEKIPESFRGELVYRTLLANLVAATRVEQAEQLFNKMKDLGFNMTVFTCNQMLLLYKRVDKKKIGDILLMMENQNLKPNNFTFHLLIDTKGHTNDIEGMEQIFETMKAEGVETDYHVQSIMAKHYATAGLVEKAELVLKEMEGNDLKSSPHLCSILLPIYADLGKAEDVERIWKTIESTTRQSDFLAAIQAFGKLKNVEQAEAIFDKLIKKYKNVSPRNYTFMLKVYAENKMLSKGKEILKRMADAGCPIGPPAWDAIVKLYVDNGEVEKADSVMQKAIQQSPKLKPMFSSYMSLLHQYSKRGDIHNAEKIFERMRQAGYIARAKPFHALLQTYINAKAPAYGIRERMKADKLFPNKGMANQLALVDAFRKTAVSELLE